MESSGTKNNNKKFEARGRNKTKHRRKDKETDNKKDRKEYKKTSVGMHSTRGLDFQTLCDSEGDGWMGGWING